MSDNVTLKAYNGSRSRQYNMVSLFDAGLIKLLNSDIVFDTKNWRH